MRLGRGFCFPPQTAYWWQDLPVIAVAGPPLGSLALSGVGV